MFIPTIYCRHYHCATIGHNILPLILNPVNHSLTLIPTLTRHGKDNPSKKTWHTAAHRSADYLILFSFRKIPYVVDIVGSCSYLLCLTST